MAATPDDADKILCTGVSMEELRQVENKVLCSKIGVDSKLKSWKAADIGDGKGFVSVMCRIELDWVTPDPKLPKSIIAKVPTLKKLEMVMGDNESLKEMVEIMKAEAFKVHNGECSIYETFMKYPDFPVTIPKLYAFKYLANQKALDDNESSYILMEDLSGRLGMVNIMKSERLSDGQTKELVRQLALLHAWCFVHIDVFKNLDLMNINEFFMKSSGSIEGSKEELKKKLSDKDDEYSKLFGEGALAKYTNGMEFQMTDIEKMPELHLKYGIPTTVTHGDIHTNNMLWKLDDKGNMTDEMLALIDWQITSLQNPLCDLCRAVNWPVNPVKRTKQYREELLDYYYQTYEAQLGSATKIPFSREQLSDAFWECFTIELKMMIPFMPNVCEQIRKKQIPGVGPEHVPPMQDNIKKMFEELHDLLKK